MIAFALAAALAATPGAALTTSPSASARPQADMPATGTPKARKPTRYCVDGSMTGTRIPIRECHTRSEWLALGFDPTAKK